MRVNFSNSQIFCTFTQKQNTIHTMVDTNIKEFLTTNIFNAAIRGGAAVMSIYLHPDKYDVSLKSDHTPITEADRLAHKTIKDYLGQTRIPILSEEGREMLYDERRNWELFWLVDPLDGTVEFINRTNEFTVNIALMENNRCVISAIYVPCLKSLYLAEADGGAYRYDDIEPDAMANYSYDDIVELRHSLPSNNDCRECQRVAISRSHNTPETFEHIDALRATYPNLEVVEQGSSYKFCMLADGAIDYYVRTTYTYEWDTAAGELILSEAGGSTRALPTDEELHYNKEHLDNPWFVCRGAHCKL